MGVRSLDWPPPATLPPKKGQRAHVYLATFLEIQIKTHSNSLKNVGFLHIANQNGIFISSLIPTQLTYGRYRTENLPNGLHYPSVTTICLLCILNCCCTQGLYRHLGAISHLNHAHLPSCFLDFVFECISSASSSTRFMYSSKP